MEEINIDIAKKRIWTRLQGKLPDRGLSVYQNELASLRFSAESIKMARLERVQSKERLLDLPPDRIPQDVPQFFPRKAFAFAGLMALLSIVILPVFRLAPMAVAAPENTLQVVEGEAYVNSVLVSGTYTVQVGDRIETGEDSMAHLFFADDSRITMGPGTVLNVTDAYVDEGNSALTRVGLKQESGRVFAQVINLVSEESSFDLDFPEGSVYVNQKASFDVNVAEGSTEILVARNLVNVDASVDGSAYFGVLGQGAFMNISDEVETGAMTDSAQEDVWFTFNLAYGKSYARQLDESYKEENVKRAIILPGNPFYFLKTFRESVQISFAFTDSAKAELLVEQAENRLNEAQTLIAQGNTEMAKKTLDVYEQTVENVKTVSGEGNEDLTALLDETQKEVLVSATPEVGTTFLSAEQKLQQVPDLIASGDLAGASKLLQEYQDESLSLLTQLEDVPMEERDLAVSELLDQKLSDIQLLRVIASLPEISGQMDIDNTIVEQLSVMVFSLRERELTDLSAFFDAGRVDGDTYDLYNQLKDGTEMTPELNEQLADIEEQLGGTAEVLVNVEFTSDVVEASIVDPRFLDAHTNETQNETEGSN